VLPGITWIDSILGAVIGGGILLIVGLGYYLIRKREGMGGGDVKLLAMIGAFLGWQSLLMTLFVASLIGSIVGICYIIFAGKDKTFPIPFGPFLAGGAISYVIWGQQFMEWLLFPAR
jgi:leader peptidase (prepilin peptidase)/N-methyltransferase